MIAEVPIEAEAPEAPEPEAPEPEPAEPEPKPTAAITLAVRLLAALRRSIRGRGKLRYHHETGI